MSAHPRGDPYATFNKYDLPVAVQQRLNEATRLLEGQFFINHTDTDPECPFGAVIKRFQAFTEMFARSIRARRTYAIYNVATDTILRLYKGFPLFRDWNALHNFVRSAMLKHPQRRNDAERRFVIISRLPRDDLRESMEIFGQEMNKAKAEMSKSENLFRDPDNTELLTEKLKWLSSSYSRRMAAEIECSICRADFPPPASWNRRPVDPQRTPCGHHFCASCLDHWRQESDGGFTCPLCRRCLVCSRSGCTFHVAERWVEKPKPLLECLRKMQGEGDWRRWARDNRALFWRMREESCNARSLIAYYERRMARETTRTRAWKEYNKNKDDAWDVVRSVYSSLARIPAAQHEEIVGWK